MVGGRREKNKKQPANRARTNKIVQQLSWEGHTPQLKSTTKNKTKHYIQIVQQKG